MKGKTYDNVRGEYAWKYGQSTKEIAKELGISEIAVETTLHRAKAKIRKWISEGEFQELLDFV